jgi:hypothetical protein
MYPLYLEKQTKDILKLNSVSNTTIRDVAIEASDVWGGDVVGLYV